MAKHLVTGGCGFIGSHLVEKLLKAGEDVTVLDNHSTGKKQHKGAKYYYGDAFDLFSIWQHNKEKFNYIWHLGEYARVEKSFDDYQKVIQSNYMSFPAVVEFAKHQQAKFIYSGSSTKFSKGDVPGYTMSPYAYTKWQNTEFLKAYASWFYLEYSIVYFYNVYGDGEISEGDYSTVIAKYLSMVKNGATELPVTEPGTQLRNFTHIDDTVNGLIMAGMECVGDEYGIASNESYSILDVVEMLGCKPKMLPSNQANRMDAEIKNQKLLEKGWEAKTSLKDYLKEKLDE